MRRRSLGIILIALLASTTGVPGRPCRAAEPAGEVALASPFAAADWSVPDAQGVEHRPWSDPETKAVVLVFISTDCPVANYYHPTLRTLTADYRERGVQLLFVHPNPRSSLVQVQDHAKAYNITAPVLLDPTQQLVRATGATKTPQAAVIDRAGEVRYLGRIDDTYAGFGQKRPQPTRHDLREALDAVLAGRPVAIPRTDSVGCFIPRPVVDPGR